MALGLAGVGALALMASSLSLMLAPEPPTLGTPALAETAPPPPGPVQPPPAIGPAPTLEPAPEGVAVETYLPPRTLTVRARTPLRASPFDEEVVETVRPGQRLRVIGRTEHDGQEWYQVRLARGGSGFAPVDAATDLGAWRQAQRQARLQEAAAAAAQAPSAPADPGSFTVEPQPAPQP